VYAGRDSTIVGVASSIAAENRGPNITNRALYFKARSRMNCSAYYSMGSEPYYYIIPMLLNQWWPTILWAHSVPSQRGGPGERTNGCGSLLPHDSCMHTPILPISRSVYFIKALGEDQSSFSVWFNSGRAYGS
jgi:hypothetical protein